MDIIEFYRSVLTSMHYSVDDEGLISTRTPTDTYKAATIEGKRLVLPTQDWLKKGFGEDFQPFHPLSEANSRRGTSEVLEHMRRNARAQLAYVFVTLANELLKVAADPSLHKELPPECNDFLRKLADADKKLIPILNNLIHAATKKNRLITVYLKNGGTYDGKKVNKHCTIRFPIIEALDGDDNNVLGVEIRPKQRKVLSNLLRLIVPFGDSPEEYSAGSNNRVAPYLHAFLLAYRKIAHQLDIIINRYAKPMDLPIQRFKLYSADSLDKFSEMYDQVPPLKGNQGAVEETEQDGSPVEGKVKSADAVFDAMNQPPTPRPVTQEPASGVTVVGGPATSTTLPPPSRQTQVQQPVTEPGTISVRELMESMRGPQAAPMGMPQPYTAIPQYGMPASDPLRPSWLTGTQPVQAPMVHPFAQAMGMLQGPGQIQSPVVPNYYMQAPTGYAAMPTVGGNNPLM